MKRCTPVILLLLLLSGFYRAQGQAADLEEKLYAYVQEHPVTNLYVHLDKQLYMPGETIWFKAYLLSRFQFQSEVLYARVVNNERQVVLEKEFPVQDVRAHGDIQLPDTLPQGDYLFYAFTDKMINFDPHDIFTQAIKVSATASQLRAEAYVNDTAALQSGKEVEIVCHLKANGASVKKARVSYTIETGDHQLVDKGKLHTDDAGKTLISFVYPAIDPLQYLKLDATFVTRDSAVARLTLHLPPRQRPITLSAAPEGGTLVQGIESRLLVEARDSYDQPVATLVLLKAGNDSIAAVTTDSMGRGIIRFTPETGRHYSFSVKNGAAMQQADFTAEIAPSGWALKIAWPQKAPCAVIYNRGMPDSALLVLRSMQEIVWRQPVGVKSGDSLLVPLPYADTSKQVLGLALFGAGGKLCNERLLLTRSRENYQVVIRPEKAAYGPREKVKVTMIVTDAAGRPASANLSVAVVARKMLNEAGYKTILGTYCHSISNLCLPAGNEEYFNKALIGKSWRRYGWPEILAYRPRGSISLLANAAGVVGYVESKKKRFKPENLKELFLFSPQGVKPLEVKDDGRFSVDAADLLADEEQENYILVNSDFHEKYTLRTLNHAAGFDSRVKAMGLSGRPLEFLTATKPPPLPPSLFAGTIALKEVEVVTRAEEIAFGSPAYQQLQRQYPPGCRDYVCLYNILNCPIHHTGSTPVIGQRYSYRGTGNYLYTHCLTVAKVPSNNFLLKRISLPRAFPLTNYGSDAATVVSYASTLYWNPDVNTSGEGTAAFEFYTSDFKGAFQVIVQGVEAGSLKVMYGEAGFSVR